MNARSLSNKLLEFRHQIESNYIDIACITETWLNSLTPNSLILPSDRFTIYRKDRDGRGSGACIVIKSLNSFTSQAIPLPEKYSDLEIVTVDLINSNREGAIIICIYNPPHINKDFDTCNRITSALSYLCKCSLPVCILGDVNLPLIDWSNYSGPNNDVYTKYLTFFSEGFTQLVNFPTREQNIFNIILVDNVIQMFVRTPRWEIAIIFVCVLL